MRGNFTKTFITKAIVIGLLVDDINVDFEIE